MLIARLEDKEPPDIGDDHKDVQELAGLTVDELTQKLIEERSTEELIECFNAMHAAVTFDADGPVDHAAVTFEADGPVDLVLVPDTNAARLAKMAQ